ncbi:MAG TPA: hypothetical protein VMZ91_09820 [Candidatus Paceibacterota bacterium]|nr:hypothetical protein [Candidatus Paceibacterota bacterium]
MADLLEILKKETKRINLRTGNGKQLNLISQETFIEVLNNHRKEVDYDLNKRYGEGFLHVLWYQDDYFFTITPLPLADL